jgi:putative hemolysin
MWGVLFEGERNERFCSTGLVRPCRPSSSAARMSQRLKSAAVVAERDLPAVVRARGGFAGGRLGHRASTRQSLGQAAAHAYRSRRQEPIAGRCDASAMGGAFSFGTARARIQLPVGGGGCPVPAGSHRCGIRASDRQGRRSIAAVRREKQMRVSRRATGCEWTDREPGGPSCLGLSRCRQRPGQGRTMGRAWPARGAAVARAGESLRRSPRAPAMSAGRPALGRRAGMVPAPRLASSTRCQRRGGAGMVRTRALGARRLCAQRRGRGRSEWSCLRPARASCRLADAVPPFLHARVLLALVPSRAHLAAAAPHPHTRPLPAGRRRASVPCPKLGPAGLSRAC